MLIDPGIFPDEIELIQSFLSFRHLSIQAILLTHSHWDHILGPERFPGVTVIAQKFFSSEAHRQQGEILQDITTWEHEYKLTRSARFVIPQPDLTFADELDLSVGQMCLRLVAIPGHTADQCAIYFPASKVLWAADTLSDLEIPFVSHSLQAYRQSLASLANLEIQALIPGHGHATSNPEEISARLNGDRTYLEDLDHQIKDTVSQGLSLEDTLRVCDVIFYRQGKENSGPHRLNVQRGYLETLHH